jgi:hypothetical protein
MTTSHPLSPIILSKLYSKEKKINISANLNKDIFSIYQIRDGTSNLNYCTQIIDYLNNNKTSNNNYYKCANSNCTISKNSTVTSDKKYIVIEFNNSSSSISVEGITYMIKKITFHVPTYHYVNKDSSYNNDTYPGNSDQTADRNVDSINNIIKNCLEIEILCDNNLNQKLSISILCNANKRDSMTNKNIDTFTDEGNERSFFALINKYIQRSNDEQLYSGGYKDVSYKLDINDILPINKHFYKYNGTSFETSSLASSAEDTFYKITRIVFDNNIFIPAIFLENILNLTSKSDIQCNDNRQLNQFIDYKEEDHSLIFSDTNIDFISKSPKVRSKVDNQKMLFLIGFVMFLMLSIIVMWAWTHGLVQNALLEIFKDNDLVLTLLKSLGI